MPAVIRRHLGTIILLMLVIVGVVVLVRTNDTAKEVVGDGLRLLSGFFFTPFILESTIAIAGILIVISWNKHQLAKETDEWVEMEVPVKQPAPTDKSSEHPSD